MATKSSIARNEKREILVARYYKRRQDLKKKLLDTSLTDEEYAEVQRQMSKFPRNSSPTRVRSRCAITGRARGVHRMFGISRMPLREMASNGEIPGMMKASW